MKVDELINLLEDFCQSPNYDPDSEILVVNEQGELDEFTLRPMEASFDGFDGYAPAGLQIVHVIRQDLPW